MSEQQLHVEPETAPIPPPVAVPAPKQNPTAYVILAEDTKGNESYWRVAGTVTAPGSAAAVRAHATKNGVADGRLVAVPVRSWQPVTIKTETSTKLVIG